MNQDLDVTLWGDVARTCWVQMQLYPKGTPNFDVANGILHCLAGLQFPVYEYRPQEAPPDTGESG